MTHWRQDIHELCQPEIEQQLAQFQSNVLPKTTVVVMKLFTKTTEEWIRRGLIIASGERIVFEGNAACGDYQSTLLRTYQGT